MRPLRSALTASMLAVLLALPVPALAGGSWAHVRPRSWARVGAEIRLSGTFCDGQQAPVTEGPWFAYLDPQVGRPILMGRVHVAANTGRYCQWRLTATVRVPAAAPGRYWLQVCDRGCSIGVGDLVGGGWFTVVGSTSPRTQAIQMQRLRTRVRRSAREEARQEQLVDELSASVDRSTTLTEELRGSVADLRDRLANERAARRSWLVGAVGSCAVAVVLASLLLRNLLRKRRPVMHVPDTPEELLELSRLDR
jgi:hypothetical protein